MSDIKLARAELAALLSSIAPVRMGRAALETTSAPLPVITLWSTGDTPTDLTSGSVAEYTRTLTLEYKTTASEDYDDALDDALSDLRAALFIGIGATPLDHATRIQETSARFFAPADGSAIAVLQLTLELTYLERL